MKKNLKNRIALIIAVLVVCLYGIFGVPHGLTGSDLLAAMTNRIHLGLDLRGGAHLILQTQVSDAVNAETDNSVQEIEQDLNKGNLTFSQVYKPDPSKPEVIRIEGTSPAQSSDVSTLLDGTKYADEYDLAQGANNTWTLTMKPIFESDLERRTVQQAIETIRDYQAHAKGHLIELYGMLETGFHTYTRFSDDPAEVNGTIGRLVGDMEPVSYTHLTLPTILLV